MGGTSWAMFRGRPDDAFHNNDNMHKHGDDTVTFLWTCPTADGFFFEETLGACMEGSDAAAAYGSSTRGGYCQRENIDGRPEDICQDLCVVTNGCTAFEVYDVEYRGVCYESGGCTTNK